MMNIQGVRYYYQTGVLRKGIKKLKFEAEMHNWIETILSDTVMVNT